MKKYYHEGDGVIRELKTTKQTPQEYNMSLKRKINKITTTMIDWCAVICFIALMSILLYTFIQHNVYWAAGGVILFTATLVTAVFTHENS